MSTLIELILGIPLALIAIVVWGDIGWRVKDVIKYNDIREIKGHRHRKE